MIRNRKANRPASKGELQMLAMVAGVFLVIVSVLLFGGNETRTIQNCSSYGADETGRILGVMMCDNGAVIDHNSSAYVNDTSNISERSGQCDSKVSCFYQRQHKDSPKELLMLEQLQ